MSVNEPKFRAFHGLFQNPLGFTFLPVQAFNQSFGSENLLFLTIFFLCLSSLLILLIKPSLSKNKNNNFNASRKATTSVLKDETYIANIAIIVALSALISRIIDYQFKITASNIYPNQENLLNFFGEFYILTGAGTLVMQLIITNYKFHMSHLQ